MDSLSKGALSICYLSSSVLGSRMQSGKTQSWLSRNSQVGEAGRCNAQCYSKEASEWVAVSPGGSFTEEAMLEYRLEG